ncbi:hypothetical protein GXM_05789 [Nostoc sphaeroides CCNUC1]|uniref:Uncharacterized protein n=1 Tax=Nostoc sphaeroides CCNUC1 TaxID=2653204 RepID=A0A5P8W6B8_9NOSO|nr:hypothetical protein GXM_05789 [Nostoc sphaeroides CCNUC1]
MFKSNTLGLAPKTLKCVGWVEERNPTFRDFVGLSKAQPNKAIFHKAKRIVFKSTFL